MSKSKISILCVTALISALAATGCSSSDSTSLAGATVYGDVTAIEDGQLTISVEEEKPDSSTGEITEDSEDSSETTDESADSSTDEVSNDAEATDTSTINVDATELTPINESLTVEVTDDVTISKQDNPSSDSMGGGQAPGGSGDGGTPPDMPSGDGGSGDGNDGGTPPDKPDGDSSGSEDGGTPPDMPDGEQPSGDGEQAEKPADAGSDSTDSSESASSDDSSEDTDNQTDDTEEAEDADEDSDSNFTLDDIQIGDDVAIQYDEDGNVESITVIYSGTVDSGQTYAAVTEVTEDTEISGETIESTGTDENAIHALNNAVLTLTDTTITQNSDSSTGGDNSSFYGVGAAVLESEGSAYVSGSTITTDAAGGAGLFAYGEGVIYAADTTIKTTQDTSGGIHVAGGGTLYAWDLDVETNGESSAAIRSDRGSGTMIVNGGTYTSNGTGSPAIYSTANIAASNITGTANNSEAICIEGQNAIRLYDSDISGNMKDDDRNDTTWNVILYQSMSGDSEEGTSLFTMDGGSLTANNGGQFYTTNTASTFVLHNVEITNSEDSEFFFKATGNSNERGWGTTGSNGADTTFTAIEQEMEGDVIWDSISEVDFYITEGSSLTGAVVDDETNAGDGGDGYCSVYIDEDSTWTVTGDSTLTNLYNAGTIVDADGNTVTIQTADGEVLVEGTSEYTITVDSYSEEVDLSGAETITQWENFEIEKPEEL